MSSAATTFKPGALGGALRKGLQMPDGGRAGITKLDGPSRAAIVLLSVGPDVAGELLKSFSSADRLRGRGSRLDCGGAKSIVLDGHCAQFRPRDDDSSA